MSMFLKRLHIHHTFLKPLIANLIIWGLMIFVLIHHYAHQEDPVTIHRHDIDVFISDTVILQTFVTQNKKEREIGLSRHAELASDEAMLFVFDQLGLYSFHMPNMDFPIDIIWLNEQKEIVHIKKSAHPSDYPEIYVSSSPAMYVLEVVDGFTDVHDIQVGDLVSW